MTFGSSRYDREIVGLALPALGSLVADPLLSLVDTGFVARVGTDALAGLGVAAALFAVAFFVFDFLEYGTTALVAKAVGAGDVAAAGRSVVTAFLIAGGSGVALTGVLLLAGASLVGLLGGRGDMASAALTYVTIRALAAPAVLLVRAAHGAYRGYQDTRTPFVVTLGINAINLVLDPILIFGLGWGVAGAAWATVVAQYAGAVAFVSLLLRSRERFGLVGARPVAGEVRFFLTVSRDLAIRVTAVMGAFTMATAVAARISDVAVAAHQVLSQVFLLTALTLDALAIAAQALIGRMIGGGRREEAVVVADRILVLGIGFGILTALVLAAFAPFIPTWFGSDPAVEAAISGALWILILMQPLGAIVFAWDGVFIGVGDFRYLAWAMVGAAAVATIVFLLVIPMGWGLPGVWWGVIVLLGVRALTLAWRRWAPGGPLRSVPG